MRARRCALRRGATSAERRLWEALRRRGCSGWRFRRQHSIGPFVVDFYCPAARVAVEVDGSVHRRPEVHAYDTDRERWLRACGVRVLRVTNDAVHADTEAVVTWIAAQLGERGDREARRGS